MSRIDSLKTRVFTIPTDRPESDGTLNWDHTTLVLVEVRSEGLMGIGYTYSHPAAAGIIEKTFREHIEGGDPLAVESVSAGLWHAARNLGQAGIVSQAISAVDVALWDLKATLLGAPLLDLLGAFRNSIPIYGSGGFTSYSIPQLCAQLSGWVGEGIPRVKMKIGRHPEEDVARVTKAREAIGPDADLFVDANGAYSVKQALLLGERFAAEGVTWFEEPVPSSDLTGLRQIRCRAPLQMEITAGEYGDTLGYFRTMLNAEAVDVVMADATRCGGYTPFLKIAALCEAAQIPLSAHTAPNLHAPVACARGIVRHVEYFHDHARIEQMLFEGALNPSGGTLTPHRDRPGIGLTLRDTVAHQYETS